MKKIIFASFFALALMSCITRSSSVQIEWRNDRTGIYHETGLLKSWNTDGPEMYWYFDGLGDGHSSVAISNKKLYVTGMNEDEKGYLYVLDMTGKLLNKVMYGDEWTISYEGTRGTPTINDGKIYLISGHGDLICFDENTLNVIWRRNVLIDFESKNITFGFSESPLIIGEKIIVTPGGKEHNVVALNKNTGDHIWSSPGMGDISAHCSPLYIGNQEIPLIVTITGSHIIGLEASTGKMLWSFECRNRNSVHANTPVYSNNMILCSSLDKGSTMLRLFDGGRKAEIIWEIPELDNMMGGMVKVGNFVYGSSSGWSSERYWYCVNWHTGEIQYRDQQLRRMGVTIYADGMLYCYSERGEMALIKPSSEKFDIVSRFMIEKGTGPHWAHPVIYKGLLFVRRGNSLMVYKIQ